MQTKHGSVLLLLPLPGSLVLLLLLLPGSLSLLCYEGKEAANSTLDQYNPAACTDHQDWCFSMFSLDKNGFNTKMCWNKDWEHGRYKEDGCIVGQHCISGVCYENATVCLCNDKDLCNGFVENGNISTPIPYPPTTPPDQHECYYGFKENNKTSGLEFTEQCFNTEQLCVRVTKDEEGYEYRSCWDSIFNIEFSRPGCYKGFQHCHSDSCHNDTLLCVCADNLCNTEKFTSESPPITPGSGLYCYARDWEDDSIEEKACSADENFCIEFTSLESDHVLRDCWNPTEYNKYNFTGCETTQSCFRGGCYNATVCICQDDLCNGFGIAGNNMTTPEPVTMTTTNKTMHCWYGFHHNGSTEHAWQREECAPQEDRCILITSTDGFAMGHCYDVNYDDGKYVSGTYETGEHCWDGTCHNGTIYVCLESMCNGEGATTPTPHHTTPGSGLDCYYGSIFGDEKKNLTTQICTKNETMCIAVYGKDDFFSGSCWDPTQERDSHRVLFSF
ncbi:uncharacterized protein LOC111708533 [Eurytemora carolleeae]|uniref:uncharacterized protein LOC111708533 n=1 Tax=Eurytemora carolleeae TaxID=1294199 RepID=UPI000C77649A|nr:uncharacterized protein LOC111708533 [Eurytemora carolleeae]|eukprot:XP_023337708.1 uncharacterized protein LOC111708533 [Eurytemora affinis]